MRNRTYLELNSPLVERYAKKMFHMEHPRSNWIEHPNYKQAQVQQRYLSEARVMLNNMLDDKALLEWFKLNEGTNDE